MTSNEISQFDLDLRSRSQLQIKSHRRGGVCVLWMLLVYSFFFLCVWQLKARDRGNPSLTGTSWVTVTIIDQNNRDPYFDPPSQSESILESKIYNLICSLLFVLYQNVYTHLSNNLHNLINFRLNFEISHVSLL